MAVVATPRKAGSVEVAPEGVTTYGFRWGPMEVTRMAHIEGRGYVIGLDTPTRRIQVYVSEQGRSVRFFDGSKEICA